MADSQLAHCTAGGYAFLPNGSPYSEGVVAGPGHRIDDTVFESPVPLERGFQRIDELLATVGRPASALCGIELRSPAPGTFGQFEEFNGWYLELLRGRGLLVDGVNPVARTNVVPSAPPDEPSIAGFSYTVPSQTSMATFVVAGAAELRGGALTDEAAVRPGEDSADALEEKATHVVATMKDRLRRLGVDSIAVPTVRVYTRSPLRPAIRDIVLAAFPLAHAHGIVYHHASPPVTGLRFEMDVRGVGVSQRIRA